MTTSDEDRPAEERLHRLLGLTAGKPPEEIAQLTLSATAAWSVVTEEGEGLTMVRRTAYLDDAADLPYWAYALAKSYLDDVGEWPLFGMKAENALGSFEDHQDPSRAVHEILAAVLPVWPDVRVVYVGEVGR